jgi:hypothetical protein
MRVHLERDDQKTSEKFPTVYLAAIFLVPCPRPDILQPVPKRPIPMRERFLV